MRSLVWYNILCYARLFSSEKDIRLQEREEKICHSGIKITSPFAREFFPKAKRLKTVRE